MVAASTGLVGTADRNAWVNPCPVIRDIITATIRLQAPMASAVPMNTGASDTSIDKASGEKARPTCVATTIWPKGRILTGTVRRGAITMNTAAVTTKGPVIQGSGRPNRSKAKPAPPDAAKTPSKARAHRHPCNWGGKDEPGATGGIFIGWTLARAKRQWPP